MEYVMHRCVVNRGMSGRYFMSIAVSRSDWDRLVELWNVLKVASTISKALAYDEAQQKVYVKD